MRKSTYFLLSITTIAVTSSLGAKPSYQRSPIEAVKAVAEKAIRDTPFEFRAILFKPDEYFNRLQVINFDRTFGLDVEGVAYAYSSLISERNAVLSVDVSHSNALQIWLNDRLIYSHEKKGVAIIIEKERDIILERSLDLELQKGVNKILVKSEGQRGEWRVYMMPRFAEVEEGATRDDRWVRLSLEGIPHITEEVYKLSRWLTIGPFPVEDSEDMTKKFPPEEEFVLGKLYQYGDQQLAWGIPKVEILADVIDADPLWGTLYDWNYHTAGFAWAVRVLGEYTEEKRFVD